MSKKFIAVYEAPMDCTTATELADRVLVEQIHWVEESSLVWQRQWVVEEPQGRPLTWKSIPSRALTAGIRVRGHFNGEPGLADAKAARRAILYIRAQISDADAIVLIRDADDQEERRTGLEQARAVSKWKFPIVIGVAFCERESWVISGFEAETDSEQALLRRETQTLGFNPCTRPEELTACKNDQAPRSPKRVIAVLTGGNFRRQRDCWCRTALDTLRKNGQKNGLVAYLDEIQSKLVPLITGNGMHE